MFIVAAMVTLENRRNCSYLIESSPAMAVERTIMVPAAHME